LHSHAPLLLPQIPSFWQPIRGPLLPKCGTGPKHQPTWQNYVANIVYYWANGKQKAEQFGTYSAGVEADLCLSDSL